MHIRIFKTLAVLTAVFALAACESTSGVKEDESATTDQRDSSSASTSGAASTGCRQHVAFFRCRVSRGSETV